MKKDRVQVVHISIYLTRSIFIPSNYAGNFAF